MKKIIPLTLLVVIIGCIVVTGCITQTGKNTPDKETTRVPRRTIHTCDKSRVSCRQPFPSARKTASRDG